MRHRAKIRANQTNSCGDMAVFDFSRWRPYRPPSWICCTPAWTTHEAYLVVFIAVQNLVWIRSVILKISDFQYCASLTNENTYSRPFLGCFLVKMGKMETFAVLPLYEWNNLVLMSYESNASKSLLWFCLWMRAKIGSQKTNKLKTTREWYFADLLGRSHWGDRFEFCRAGAYCNCPLH